MTGEPSRFRVPPVVQSVRLVCAPSQAFDLFTRDIHAWWPLSSHSVAQSDAVACAFEPWVGGRLIETARDGTTHTWGVVTTWEPGRRLAMTWHPGRRPTGQTVEVSFLAEGDETIVTLRHDGWDSEALDRRQSYEAGWASILNGNLAGHAARAIAGLMA